MSSTPYTMNKDCIEPLVIEDESFDGTVLQTNNNNTSLCVNENQVFTKFERSTNKMDIGNGNKNLVDLQEKESLGRQCPICFKRFMRQDYFIHIRHSHLESYPHQCKFCKFMCQDLNQLRHHVKKKHENNNIKSNSFINKESIRELSYNSTEKETDVDILSDEDNFLIENIRKSEKNIEEGSFSCPICFRKLKTLPNLKKHVMQHSYKRLECLVCQYLSIFKGQMSSHYYQEHPSKKIQWKEVFLDIGGPNNLVEDVEPYILQVKVKYGIRKPNKTSSLQRQYQCPHCDYISNFNSSYNRHLRIHGGKKDFKCGYCNFHAREAYVIHKHSKKMHLNCEVKIEKDIGYNVPYRYSKQPKISSFIESEIKTKKQDDPGRLTSSTLSNDAIKEKVETFISDKGPNSICATSKISNVVNASITSRHSKQILDYGIEKLWDHSYYEKSKVSTDAILYDKERRDLKVNVVSLNKGREYVIETCLEKNEINNLNNKELKVIEKYEGDKTSINLESQLFEESRNIEMSHQKEVSNSKSRSEFQTDARSLTLKKGHLTNYKSEMNREISIVDKNTTKINGAEVYLSENQKDHISSKKNDFISDQPSIVLCENNDFESDTILILSIDQEVIENTFNTNVPIILNDDMKGINETLPANNDSLIGVNNTGGDSFSEEGSKECPKVTETENKMINKIIPSIEYENTKDSEIYEKDNEFDVHKKGLENDNLQKTLVPPILSNVPYASDWVSQNIGLDYQNRDYFNPDNIRNMMKILGNGRLECTICCVSTTKRAFYKHAKKHFNIKPYQCGHCNYRSIEKSMIRGHNSRCHSGSHCVIIKLSPKNASNLSQDLLLSKHKIGDDSDLLGFENNMSNHITDKSMKLNFEEDLNTESRNIKNKPISASNQLRLFICPVCQKELRYHHPTVRRHLYVHYNYKPYKCGLCHFTSSTAGEIRGHHVTHRTTEEARIESSGAVMNPNLTKLLEESVGYGHTIT